MTIQFVRRIAVLLFASSSICVAAAADDVALPQEARSILEWIQSLGYPDPGPAQWVKYWDGSFHSSNGQAPIQEVKFGFLLSAHNDEFTIWSSDLREVTRKKVAGAHEYEKVDWTEASFEDLGRKSPEAIAGLLKPQGGLWMFPHEDPSLSLRTQIAFLAYAAWKKSQSDLALKLLEVARTSPGATRDRFQQEQVAPPQDLKGLKDAIAAELGIAEFRRAVMAFEPRKPGYGSTRSRKELVIQFRRYIQNFPTSGYLGRAKDVETILSRMVQEDEAHRALSDEAVARLPLQDQIREWIFRLRDQSGHKFVSPGRCDIFEDMLGSEAGNSPAHRLVQIGFAAVPQLIDALGDERFSRAVDYADRPRSDSVSHHVLSVGHCAALILDRISISALGMWKVDFEGSNREAEITQARKTAQSWWTNASSVGEAKLLVEAISSPTLNTIARSNLVHRLMAKDPQAAVDAVLAGAKNTMGGWKFAELVRSMGELKDERADAFLKNALHQSSDLEGRLAVAKVLHSRGDPDALAAMLAEWRKLRLKERALNSNACIQLLSFLAGTGKSAVIKALMENFSSRDVRDRLRIIGELAQAPFFSDPSTRRAPPRQFEDPALIEGIFLQVLDDTEETQHSSQQTYPFANPRVCDLALWGLHGLKPARYASPERASVEQRDAERKSAAAADGARK